MVYGFFFVFFVFLWVLKKNGGRSVISKRYKQAEKDNRCKLMRKTLNVNGLKRCVY